MVGLETAPKVRVRMKNQRSRDTDIETALRKSPHAARLRCRVHRRPLKGARREADISLRPGARRGLRRRLLLARLP